MTRPLTHAIKRMAAECPGLPPSRYRRMLRAALTHLRDCTPAAVSWSSADAFATVIDELLELDEPVTRAPKDEEAHDNGGH